MKYYRLYSLSKLCTILLLAELMNFLYLKSSIKDLSTYLMGAVYSTVKLLFSSSILFLSLRLEEEGTTLTIYQQLFLEF